MLVAAIQLTSKSDKKKNLAVASALMERALRQGAELVALPEYFSFIGKRADIPKEAEQPKKGLAFDTAANFAAKNGVFVLAGGIPTLTANKKLVNRSYLIGQKGEVLGFYDKIHLFDSELTESRAFRESDTFARGTKPGLVETPFGKAGLTICYDLRFPELYRVLALAGARVIFVPSAFTMYTGKDHWLSLLKARAIENQVYIVAPAQIGRHTQKKVSWGKTSIIDPWGSVLATAPDCETVVLADIDFKFLAKVRKELPVLNHYRKDVFSLL
ncbi:MAG TPA: carbon-nitrogen hydrolase family protein [Oligoflexia bacterium]|nr:carbon-nitrogen hydrolase family protein [Oligoflexia bacterium]